MNCNPSSLAAAAACYTCIPKPVMQASMISLLCEWANHLTPPPCQISWTPVTAPASWVDSGGPHIGNLAFFLATADINTVTTFSVDSGGLTSLSCLEYLPNLSILVMGSNPLLLSIDLTKCLNLTYLQLDNSALTSLDVTQNTLLTYLDCSMSPGITSLNLSSNINLQSLACPNCNITGTLNFSGLSNVTTVNCAANVNLTDVNAAGCTSLDHLDCNSCQLGTLTITGDFAITYLDISGNPAVVVIGP